MWAPYYRENEVCTIDGCDKPTFCRDWCSAHYSRWQRHGDPMLLKRRSPFRAGDSVKWCSRCEQEKPPADFGVRNRGALSGYCNPCKVEYDAEYARTPAGQRARRKASQRWAAGPSHAYNLQWRYGITVDDYERMREEQGNVCGICGADEPGGNNTRWCVDHCHDGGFVRGLLCVHCNMAIGQMRHDPVTLRAAADYVEASRRKRSPAPAPK